jgi:iron complex outermembrane receptor protein
MKAFTIYTGISKGFSSPTTSELRPTGGAINNQLEAEYGTSYDFGVRATLFNKLNVDINAFSFGLKSTIVQRRDALGGDFYVNAGSTKQHGIESYLSYPFSVTNSTNGLIWISHSFHDFTYKEFAKGNDDFSGKRLPGEPKHALSSGIDYGIKGLRVALTHSYSGKVPLNDANSFYADAYHLLGFRLSYEKTINRIGVRVFAGAENLLDEQYSLGNDINGFGGRFFNAAPGRNYYAGLNFIWNKKKRQGQHIMITSEN